MLESCKNFFQGDFHNCDWELYVPSPKGFWVQFAYVSNLTIVYDNCPRSAFYQALFPAFFDMITNVEYSCKVTKHFF